MHLNTRLAEGRPAHGAIAGRGCDLPDERALAWGKGNRHRRNDPIFVTGLPLRWSLAWPELYGRIDAAIFLQIVHALLLLSGVTLIL